VSDMPSSPLLWVLIAWLASAACRGPEASPAEVARDVPPADLLGEFEDDYGIRYTITPSEWRLWPDMRFEIVAWNSNEQYLVARNGDDNPSEAGLWTRIDWMELPAGSPYRYGFCLSAFDAPTRDAARATAAADRSEPMTGCNGFPFSRLKPWSATTP